MSSRSIACAVGSLWLASLALAAPSAPADPYAVGVIPSDDPHLHAPASRSTELTAEQVLDMTRLATDLIGGLGSVVPDTARLVVIKPNVVTLDASGSGVVTDARVVRAVAILVHEVVPQARILVAEGAAGWRLPGVDGFETAGHRATVRELRARGIDIDCRDLNDDAAYSLRVPGGGLATDEYDIAATLVDADAWINCPVAKTHGAKITCSMKNQIGILPGRLYGWPKSGGTEGHPPMPHAPRVIDELLVDLWLLSRPDLNVVDMIAGVEAGGFWGEPKRSNLIVAGRDAVATDLVVARLMGFNPRDLEFADLARQRGMGPGSIDRVDVRGAPIDPLVSRFKKAGLSYGYVGTYGEWGEHADYGMGPRRWILLGPLPRDHRFAEAETAQLDPVPGGDGWSPVTWFGHDKIDLDALFHDPVHCSVYAFTRFTMAHSDSVRFWIGSDEDLQVWLDGEPIYGHTGRRRHRLGQDRLPGHLAAGAHRLLVRAEQGRGPFDFSINICEPIDNELYAGNTHPGVGYPATAAEQGADLAVQVRARDVFDGQYVQEDAATLDRPARNEALAARPDSARLPVAQQPLGGSLLSAVVAAAGLHLADVDSADLACMSLTPFGFAYTGVGLEDPFPRYGPKPVRLLGWLGLDYSVTAGLGWQEALAETEQWLASGRTVVAALGDEWVLVTGYRARAGQAELHVVAPDTARWVLANGDWGGRFPGGVWANCPVVVVTPTAAPLSAAALVDSMAALALEMGLRDRIQYAPQWWRASPAPAGLAAWDSWVTWWERLPWTPAWAAEPSSVGLLSEARPHLVEQARARRMACEYFGRAAARERGNRRAALAEAAHGYDRAATALRDLGELLPENGGGDGLTVEDAGRAARLSRARSLLRGARDGERQALQALAHHLDRPDIPPIAQDPLRHKAAGRKLFTWRADHHQGLCELTLVEVALQQRWLSGQDADGVRREVFAAPVQRPGWAIAVEAVKGEGVYEVAQQPAAGNNWTAVVRVDDRLGDFRMRWQKDSFETELIVWAVPEIEVSE